MSFDIYKCWGCGEDLRSRREPQQRAFCETCFDEHQKRHKEIVKEYAAMKIKVMHENALRIMEKSGVYMHEYQDAAREVFDVAIDDTEKFFSSYEMIVAMILLEYGYEFQINYKILKYRVDFFIPELKVCLEVDGDRHEHKTAYDNTRDLDLREHLGLDWEIVRIPTKYIDKDPTKIPDAIEALKKEKQRLRKNNHGIIPDHFSKRERDHYKSILGTTTKRVRKV